ncbi:hypothetical protein Patl1_21619 [Pistacia atlantica]|uniref:Uncharacterized protein n=1 Tax=Pistacia atlantica TaxID=434234 RepID=A0ACC1BIP4_9ROSI|nr:hypothetical protein Patl1_21619 [Pistacia atlantica]
MEKCLQKPSSSSSSSSTSFDDLPREKWWGLQDTLYQWEGFWYILPHLKAAIAARSNFEARDDDILLASSMKTGTTWLKALIPSIINHNPGGEEEQEDPLLRKHPNELMPSFEVQLFKENPNPDLSGMVSPRLFRTHMPYTMLPESVKNSGCKIVYITRDPKDTIVSLWHFSNSVHSYGPFHDRVLEYWKESQKRPGKILFLKYEEMKQDTKGQVQKLASFLGKPFVNEEDLNKVLWRCNLDRLKNLEVNKTGVDPWLGIMYKSYFRLGSVGDWKNSLSQEMKERLDEVTCKKLEGSGLVFGA